MIRVAVAVRSRSVRGALERGLRQRASIVVVPFPVGGAAPWLANVDADVVLVDLVEWSQEAAAAPHPAVIALAEAPDDAVVVATLRAGARGVLPYDADIAAVTAAVEAAAAGLVVMPAGRSSGRSSAQPEPTLTEREREVLILLAAGLPNRAIGERLGIAEQTVKTYVAAILDKLDAATRAEAVAIGLRRGLIML